METGKILHFAVVQEKVSNPLGWDGDPTEQQMQQYQQAVSNPLGWDGDRQHDICNFFV